MLSHRQRCAVVVFVAITASSTAPGAPYYNLVIDATSAEVVGSKDASGESVITDTGTGVTVPFPTSGPYSGIDRSKLPGVYGIQGVTYPVKQFFPIEVFGSNRLGTVVGAIPSGASRAEPYSDVLLGWSQLQPDGQYSPIHLISPSPLSRDDRFIAVNSANQILYETTWGAGVIDLRTGITTPVIIPPDIRASFVPNSMTLQGFSDNGSIVASALVQHPHRPGQDRYTLVLSPPESSLPAPIPEPGALPIWGAAGLVLLAMTTPRVWRRHTIQRMGR